MLKSPQTPYLIIVAGLLIFFAGMAIDLIQHGKVFLAQEFQEAPFVPHLMGTLPWRRYVRRHSP